MHMAGIRNWGDLAASRTTLRAADNVVASGFSHTTCFPACNAAMACAGCNAVGVQMSTRSTL